jgi:hypothetical protein
MEGFWSLSGSMLFSNFANKAQILPVQSSFCRGVNQFPRQKIAVNLVDW